MSKSDVNENSLLLLIFNATLFANIAINATASPETNLGWALHTGAGPLDVGTQLTLEAAYTSYAREDRARTSGGFTVTTNSVSPAADVDFTEATGGTETETFGSIGKASSDVMLYYGALTPTIAVVTGVTPRITAASTITED